jgi:hypothetical protein
MRPPHEAHQGQVLRLLFLRVGPLPAHSGRTRLLRRLGLIEQSQSVAVCSTCAGLVVIEMAAHAAALHDDERGTDGTQNLRAATAAAKARVAQSGGAAGLKASLKPSRLMLKTTGVGAGAWAVGGATSTPKDSVAGLRRL